MEDNLTVDPAPVPNQPIPHKPNYLLLFLILILIITTAILSYFVWTLRVQVDDLKQPSGPVKETAKVQVNQSTPSTVVQDETANWKIYTNNKYGYSFKYPTNYKYHEEPGGGYQIPESTMFSISSEEWPPYRGYEPIFEVFILPHPTDSWYDDDYLDDPDHSRFSDYKTWTKAVNGVQAKLISVVYKSGPTGFGYTDGTIEAYIPTKDNRKIVLRSRYAALITSPQIITRLTKEEAETLFDQILSTFKFL